MKNFDIPLFISILASLTHITAFVIYNYKQIFGNSKPNIISWFLWAGLASLNFLTYKSMSQNWIVSLLSLTGSAMCTLTFLISLIKGKFSKLNWVDYAALSLGLISICVWALFKSAMYSNFIVLFGASIGFVPTYKSVFSNPRNEPPLPWLLWSTAFFLGFIVVILKFDGKWGNFVYPVSMFILHGGVWIKLIKKNN
jgi:hypothetical protein